MMGHTLPPQCTFLLQNKHFNHSFENKISIHTCCKHSLYSDTVTTLHTHLPQLFRHIKYLKLAYQAGLH